MNGLADTFFGPLGEEYCNLFLILSIFTLLGVIAVVIHILKKLIREGDKLATLYYGSWSLGYALFAYYVARLHYTICQATL